MSGGGPWYTGAGCSLSRLIVPGPRRRVRLLRVALSHPLAEERDAMIGPRCITGHRTVREALCNCGRVVFDILIPTEVESEAHPLNIAITEEGADVLSKARHA